MTTLNELELEFFNLTLNIRNPLTVVSKNNIYKSLLKLNNPTYYSKFIYKNPIERHGYTSSITKHPILQAIRSMLNNIKTSDNLVLLQKNLQTEMAWAFHTILAYKLVDL